jgi:hypothetical protein
MNDFIISHLCRYLRTWHTTIIHYSPHVVTFLIVLFWPFPRVFSSLHPFLTSLVRLSFSHHSSVPVLSHRDRSSRLFVRRSFVLSFVSRCSSLSSFLFFKMLQYNIYQGPIEINLINTRSREERGRGPTMARPQQPTGYCVEMSI